ncbi:MAG: hypothetical protein H0U79_08170 [Solirubrobacterales bacterium]|nr:hypothetical protein [Solirubrobacterales bacterium]
MASQPQIQVREVTSYQFSWTLSSPGAPGTFTLQLILDQGAEERLLSISAEDADVIKDLLQTQERAFFDMTRDVLMFGVSATK